MDGIHGELTGLPGGGVRYTSPSVAGMPGFTITVEVDGLAFPDPGTEQGEAVARLLDGDIREFVAFVLADATPAELQEYLSERVSLLGRTVRRNRRLMGVWEPG